MDNAQKHYTTDQPEDIVANKFVKKEYKKEQLWKLLIGKKCKVSDHGFTVVQEWLFQGLSGQTTKMFLPLFLYLRIFLRLPHEYYEMESKARITQT